MKKFFLLSFLSFFAISSAMAGYSYYEGCQRQKRINYVDLLSPCHQASRIKYPDRRCDYSFSYSQIARPPRTHTQRYTLTTPTPRPFYAQITSNKTINNYAHARYGNIENAPLGDRIKFYPDFTSFSSYPNVTWKWHYDSRGLQCIESSAGTLDCVIDRAIPSEVWAEFFVPEYKNSYWGKTFRSNTIKVYPRVGSNNTYVKQYQRNKQVHPNYNQLPFSHFYFYGY
jgi:hypothetical protein